MQVIFVLSKGKLTQITLFALYPTTIGSQPKNTELVGEKQLLGKCLSFH